jgi:hypothetical protein
MKAGRLTQAQVRHIEQRTRLQIAVVGDPVYDTSGRVPTKIHPIKFRGQKRWSKVREG